MAFVVFAGQSNTGGAYMTASTLAQPWGPDPLTSIWNTASRQWETLQPGVNTGYGSMANAWGPEVQFALDFRARYPSETLYIVKSAEGGTGLARNDGQWVYDWSPTSPNELFSRALSAVDAASANLGGKRPDAVFWGQGEEDATTLAASQAYGANLGSLFSAVRSQWMRDAGGKIGFFQINTTTPYATDVRRGEAQVDAADGNALSLDTVGFSLQADGLHFDAAAYNRIGHGYFDMLSTWRGQTGPTPPPSGAGQVITSPGPGSTLVGTAGADTLNASQGSDTLTGGAGADTFAWGREPWSPATLKDFAAGTDRLDLSKVFQAAGYAGADPIADGRIVLLGQGADTLVLFDDDGAGGDWPNYIIKLEGVATAGLTWAKLAGEGPTTPTPPTPPTPPPPPASGGQVINSAGPGSTLIGTAGADTLNSSRGSDVLTGGQGADHFVFAEENWSPARITDFQDGIDRIDIRGMLDRVGYAGSDPVGAGYLKLIDDEAGGTKVLFDRDLAGPDPVWPNYILHVENVAPSALTSSDWIFQ